MTVTKQSVAAMVLIGLAVPAAAQTTTNLPPYANNPTWTGFYVGAAFGAGAMSNRADTSAAGFSATLNAPGGSGVLGSIYGGVDYRVLPRAVIGLLGEVSLAGFQSSNSVQVPGGNATVASNAGFGWAALVRAGVLANPSTLIYLVGGYTGQNIHTDAYANVNGASAYASRDDTVNGWTFGPGVETVLDGRWSAKLEYRYSQFEQKTLSGTNLVISPSSQAVRVGLAYKFGGLAPSAADQEPEAAPAPFNWTGFYGGVAGGGGIGFNRTTAQAGGASASFDATGQSLLGSVFAGFDYQVARQAVAGVMGDFTWASLQSNASLAAGGNGVFANVRADRSWSVMGRLGFLPVPSTMIYGAAGYTGENVNATATAAVGGNVGSVSQDATLQGWTVGPGIETVVTGGWTTRLEYRYSQYEQKQIVNGVTTQPASHTIRLGLAYKFGVGIPAPGGE